MGSKGDIAAKIEDDTNKQMREMRVSVDKNKGKVIERVLSLVYNIKPEVHQNLRVPAA